MSRLTDLADSARISRLLAVIVTVVVITTLYLAKTVILPLALALLFTFVLAPLVTWSGTDPATENCGYSHRDSRGWCCAGSRGLDRLRPVSRGHRRSACIYDKHS